jgi:hypothetical protein
MASLIRSDKTLSVTLVTSKLTKTLAQKFRFSRNYAKDSILNLLFYYSMQES